MRIIDLSDFWLPIQTQALWMNLPALKFWTALHTGLINMASFSEKQNNVKVLSGWIQHHNKHVYLVLPDLNASWSLADQHTANVMMQHHFLGELKSQQNTFLR